MVLVVAETLEGKVRKSALEAVYYGSKVAELSGSTCTALILGPCVDGGKLGQYGAKEILHVDDAKLQSFDSQVFSKAISSVAELKQAKIVIVSDSSTGQIGRAHV